MNKQDIQMILKGIAPAIRSYIADMLKNSLIRLDSVEKQLQSIPKTAEIDIDSIAKAASVLVPVPKDGKDADIEILKSVVKAEVAIIPIPKDGIDGKDGVDGKDADPELIKALVSDQVALIPIPENGKDGVDGKDVDLDYVKSLVDQQVAEKIALLPVPKDGIDGKNVEIEQVKALVDEVFAQIPAPKDGKDGVSVDPEQVKQLIAEEVAKTPAPENGKDADPEIIKAMVAEAVSAIPIPENGKDADPELIKALVTQAVAEIPTPKNGKDADPDLIKAMVDEAVSAIPPAKDGKDADLTGVKALILQEIQNIPPVDTLSAAEIQDLAKAAASEVINNVGLPSDGKDGKDGENGRDALDIQILPVIDETKSYPRGTYAQHKNGVWRTFQKSHGMKGWECIIAGIAEINIEQVDERRFTVKTVLSTGETMEKGFSMQNTIYKGVYQEGENYEKGDFATWGGNIWHCNEPTSDRPKEGITTWTLAVKRGRDYKEPASLPKRNPDDPVKLQ